jgi:hypothetical protein
MTVRAWAKHLLRRVDRLHPGFSELRLSIEAATILAAKGLVDSIRSRGIVTDLRDVEFRVFSQFGEDGILQYLLQHVPVPARTFVEFGVGDYTEANTKFLVLNDDWGGLIMDGSRPNILSARSEPWFWMHDVRAVSAFINRDNIDGLIRSAGITGDIGLLSIDIDGNDYWVWERLSVVRPAIAVVEYNSLFGGSRAVTVPYDSRFARFRAHWSGVYWGASLKALCVLAERKGYAFVGSNSAGNNAFFVRRDLVGPLPVLTAEQGWVAARFREARDRRGRLTYGTREEAWSRIRDLPVVDVETGRTIALGAAR